MPGSPSKVPKSLKWEAEPFLQMPVLFLFHHHHMKPNRHFVFPLTGGYCPIRLTGSTRSSSILLIAWAFRKSFSIGKLIGYHLYISWHGLDLVLQYYSSNDLRTTQSDSSASRSGGVHVDEDASWIFPKRDRQLSKSKGQ